MDDVRETLDRLIRDRGEDYSSISRLLGRNAAYVQQFIRRGVPRKLDEDDRRTLAAYFAVDEAQLGGPVGKATRAALGKLLAVPQLDVRVSAGPGGAAIDERAVATLGFDPRWLRSLTATPDLVSSVRVQGDSMSPTLADGDDLLVDRGDGPERLRDGIYVLRIDDALNVKRLAVQPGRRFAILSDNIAYPPLTDWRRDQVEVIGRVIWVGRRLA